MKLALYAPYGSLHKEGGLLYLVANYLAKNGAEVAQLRCDGAVAACGRDRGAGAVRSPFQCARCLNDQRALAHWAGASIRDVSSEITPDDVQTVAQWMHTVAHDALERAEFRGVNLWSACRSELVMRWEELNPAALTEAQELDIRALFVSYVRTAVASERFLSRFNPDLVLIASIHDPLSHAFALQAKQAKIDTVVGWYNPERECIGMESVVTRQSYSTSLILEGLASMRSDPRTWGPEITAVVHEALTFLGCAPDRLA